MTEEHPLYALAREVQRYWLDRSLVVPGAWVIVREAVDDAYHKSGCVMRSTYTGTFEYLVCSGFFSAEKMDALYAELVLAGAHRDPETGELWEQET